MPYPDDGKVKIPMIPCSVEKKEWTKEELVEQLRPMCKYILCVQKSYQLRYFYWDISMTYRFTDKFNSKME